MSTRDGLRASLRYRLGETAADVWTNAELDDGLNNAIRGLYPYYYLHKVATTTAGAGPVQTSPEGCRNIYQLGMVPTSGTRVRPIRNWAEGTGNAVCPKLGITGLTLVWSWTEGFDAPASGTATLDIPVEAEEMVIVRAQITALERILTNRTKREKYFAVQVREGVTEQDLLDAIDALHATMREHAERAAPLPIPVK